LKASSFSAPVSVGVSWVKGVSTPPKCALSAGDVVAERSAKPLKRSAFFLCFQNSWRLTYAREGEPRLANAASATCAWSETSDEGFEGSDAPRDGAAGTRHGGAGATR
jgi:hypothetical protein